VTAPPPTRAPAVDDEALGRLRYLPLERLRVRRPVDRLAYVRERCRGLRVLDLGAYDETEVVKCQHGSWRWLHAEIAAVAREVLGVDAAPELAGTDGVTTACGTRIVHGRVESLDAILRDFRPDLVVAGELIEHTPDTPGWLTRIGEVRPGTRLLATTPNATSVINLVLAFISRENTHQDHIQIYSYKTLATLARRIALRDVVITPYYYHSHLMRGRAPRPLLPLVYAADYLGLMPIQYLFPLTAGGLILEGVLGRA
jgi:2-polyprenyl-3-methyl-5-hydroxy-6-metoxy-1,4-benzoquinol methylase